MRWFELTCRCSTEFNARQRELLRLPHPPRRRPSAPSGTPERPVDDGAGPFPPAGWQNRPRGASPRQPARNAPSRRHPPRPFEVERPAAAPEPQRAPALNRASGASGPAVRRRARWPATPTPTWRCAARCTSARRRAAAGHRLRAPGDGAPAHRRAAQRVITEQNITMSRPDRLRLVEILTTMSSVWGRSRHCSPTRTSPKSWSTSHKQIYVEQHGKLTLSRGDLRERRAVDAGDRPHREQHRPPHRRVVADGRRPPQGRLPRQRVIPPLALRGPTASRSGSSPKTR